jgi:hypothetical protein
MSRKSFFNAADAALDHLVDAASFDESLILNLLFQERVLLHEAYFFSSGLLTDHVARNEGHPSLFVVASRRGLIVPAFRDPTTQSLEHAFDLMQDNHIYGQSWMRIPDSRRPIVLNIVAAIDEGLRHTSPEYWPTGINLGAGFQSIVQQLLQREDPPFIEGANVAHKLNLQAVWEPTKKWRFECVNKAIEATTANGQIGLQRTELYRALAAELNAPVTDGSNAINQFFEHCENLEQRLNLEAFLKWIAQCHHINFAKSLGVGLNFPVYNIDQDFIVDSLVRTLVDGPPSKAEGFRVQVELPPIDVLRAENPEDLLAIRSDHGLGYLLALKKWQNDPSNESLRGDIESTLKLYASQICKRYASGTNPMVATYEPASSQHFKTLRDAMIQTTVANAPIPGVGIFMTVASLVRTTYRYIRSSQDKTVMRPRQKEIEVTIPPTI